MSKFATAAKRILVGRPFRSDRLAHTLLPKRIALPVFASDALSSVAYAPQEIFLTLSIAGLATFVLAPWIGLLVVIVLLAVVASYRQNVHAYPSGGGDYEVATVNLGKRAGLTVASALLVDYVLTVAVSIAAAVQNLGSLAPFVSEHKIPFAVGAIVLVTVANLRGLRESGAAFAVPTYLFMVGIFGMIIWGAFSTFVLGHELRAESAGLELVAEDEHLVGFAFAFLLMRAFTTGCAALTGIEAISNGVPAFRKPKSKNAASTLLMLGLIAVTMFMGVIWLAQTTKVVLAEDPARQLVNAPPGYQQDTVIAQVADAVFGEFRVGYFFVVVLTALILVLAANTAFNGFPVLGSILAQDRYLPRQLHTRGDRLAFSNGITFLAGFAILLVVAFDADPTRLIPLYTVGVFVSFTLSQAGMIRHWQRLLRSETGEPARRRMRRSQAINAFGLAMTGSVLVIVLITKFTVGAWVAIVAMILIFVLMAAIRRHYDRVSAELHRPEDQKSIVLPSRNHAIVLVSTLHLPTLRALAYAKATRPDLLEAVTVNVQDTETKKLVSEWDKLDVGVGLKVIESPYRDITRPVLDYVRMVRSDNPRHVVTVFIPEYVVGHWWEQLLHNQSALRLKGRLLFQPGVMVTSVPWQLASSEKVREAPVVPPGSVRRGLLPKNGDNGDN
ncbi:APC family permease [Actinokineospora sp.]|uniref:APC family permease n=1 Tax=Actinokineospora sp. TaxID=1872133 RepID=UPI0040382BBE